MKRWIITAVVGLAVVVVAWLLVPVEPSDNTESVEHSASADMPARRRHQRAATSFWGTVFDVPESGGTLRGTVIGDRGPVRRATVVVTPSRAKGALTGEPCPCDETPYLNLIADFCSCDEAIATFLALTTAGGCEAPVVGGDTTNADGTFEITDLDPGRYTLIAEHAVEGSAVLRDLPAIGDPLRVRLEPTVDILGEVLDDYDEPLVGVTISSIEIATGRFVHLVTDNEGEFELRDVHDGAYYFVASLDGYFPTFEVRYPDEEEVTLWLERPRIIVGQVRRADGAPVNGATVTLRSPLRRNETTTDMVGAFTFTDIEPGEYYVVADKDGQLGGKLVDLEPGLDRRHLVLTLTWVPGSELTGLVTDEAGTPLAGARVVIDTEEPWGTDRAVADATGRYHVRPLPPGEYEIVVEAAGHQSRCAWIEIVGDQSTVFDATLVRASPMHGAVYQANGRPVVGALITLESLDSEDIGLDELENLIDDAMMDDEDHAPVTSTVSCDRFDVVTDIDGAFTLTGGLPPGEYDLYVERDGVDIFNNILTLPDDSLIIEIEADEDEAWDDELDAGDDLVDEFDAERIASDASLLMAEMASARIALAELEAETDDLEVLDDRYLEELDDEIDDDFDAELDDLLDDEGWADIDVWGADEDSEQDAVSVEERD